VSSAERALRRTGVVAAGLGLGIAAIVLAVQATALASGSLTARGALAAAACVALFIVLLKLVPAPSVLAGWACAMYVFLFVPIVVVVVYAFNSGNNVASFAGFSTKWFSTALHDATITDSVLRSVEIALTSTALSIVLGTAAALGLAHARRGVKGGYEGIVLLTLVVPELVIAVSLLLFFVNAGFRLGLMTMALGHAVFGSSLVALVVGARVRESGITLQEAAADVGAGPWATLRDVTVPTLAPAIVAGGLLAFTLSFDDVVISQFTSGAGHDTWPLRVLGGLRFGLKPDLNATATLMLGVTVVLLGLAGLAQRRTR
jgi:ABC-type spermidine/putrescine transport system permease subunit II